MSDPKKLDSVEPIKSVEELENETGGASSSTDVQEEENPSLLGAALNPFLSSSQDGQQDGTTAPSETTENSEG